MGSPVPKPRRVAEHELDGNRGHVNAHARRQRFADEEEAARELPRRGAEGVFEQLIRRIDFALQVMRHHHDREQDAGDDVPDDDLEEGHVSAVGHGGHADDGERARLGGDDGEANAPPRNVFAAEEIVAGVALVFAEPDAEPDDAQQIGEDDQPVREVEEIHGKVVTRSAGFLVRAVHPWPPFPAASPDR